MGVMHTILVANRGEIAVRVIRTAQQMGFRTVAVFTDVDADAPHVELADLAVRIGEGPVGESYLNADRLLDAIERSGANAVHPGYGFLSENADFARAVVEAGAIWIGPPPAAIEAMGDKASSKALMKKAGVPCVPGFSGDSPDDAALIAAATEVGFPLLVKASAGGGGRGMRRVLGPDQLEDAIRSARAEAENAFGDGTLLLERLIERGRHVEVQVMADAHGAVIHLGERDCSVQRRHQKVIEEAPSPAVDEALRARMGEAACAAARAVGYVGAGTVEFLLGDDGFHFLEMNTRLQVEHPVTEEITGLDLVELQLRVATGEPLPLSQDQVRFEGHAIEARLYAEDPSEGYRPQPGLVVKWAPPKSIRVDAGLADSGEISPFYDPMVAKLIATGPDRETARRRLLRALAETVLFGVRTNRDLLGSVLSAPEFIAGDVRTDFLDGRPELTKRASPDPRVTAAALVLWKGPAPGFRNAHPCAQPFSLEVDGERLDGRWTPTGVVLGEQEYQVQIHDAERVTVDGLRLRLQVHRSAEALFVRHSSTEHRVAEWAFKTSNEAEANGRILMPMAGQVLAVPVAVGDNVEAGDVVAIVEAMKLETPLKSPIAGVVCELPAAVGAALATRALVAVVEPEESP